MRKTGVARAQWSALATAVLLLIAPRSGAQELDLGFLQTRAEATGYAETTGYDEAVAFLEVAAAQSDRLHITTFGYTTEGRSLPLVVWGDVDPDPVSLREDTRLRIYLQGNIHAGEVCGKEAMLALVRDLAAGGYDAWLDDVVLLIAPIYNADGNERVSLYNRPRQHGPVGGMGQRPNARNLDLNRDHMKLASPEARSLVRMISAYDPHVLVDLHTTNGSRHGYHLTYAPPLNPNTHPAIDGLLRDELLPAVTDAVREQHGWEFYHYGNLPFRNAPRGWYTFDHRPRFSNNYAGLRNRFGILSEAYSYASFEDRVRASRAFVEAIVNYAAANREAMMGALREADDAVLPGSEYGVTATWKPTPEDVPILLGEVEQVRNPYSGAPMLLRTDETRVEDMPAYIAFQAAETTVLPEAYLIPPGHDSVIALLKDHGVEVMAAPGGRALGEAFGIDSTRVAERAFQGVNERTILGSWAPRSQETTQEWTRVPLAQPLGRLVAYLLEPRSDDGIVNWDLIQFDGPEYPILRIPAGHRE
ncbi:MAG: M14 family metallopeptidase [Rhodothermales bacterium]|nr:M14 family metallopeptidase [Rhodothermales bacterium]MBO6781576.1 M14 family metallopeptidase [Rhodothermales bacterium]